MFYVTFYKPYKATNRTQEEQVICSTEEYPELGQLSLPEFLEGTGLAMRGREQYSEGSALLTSISEPHSGEPKVWSFSNGPCSRMVVGEEKASLHCGECGEAGDESPWFTPFFIADCDTPICLYCMTALQSEAVPVQRELALD